MTETVETETTFVFAYPYMAHYTEVHVKGCKAAGRSVKKVETEVFDCGATKSSIEQMQANPDEGFLKIHACAQSAGLKQRKESAV